MKIISVLKKISKLEKVTVSLGVNDDEGKILFKSLNRFHPKYIFIRNKTIGVSLLNLSEFRTNEDYLVTVSGKNSTAYYSRKCLKDGYIFRILDPNKFQTEILTINSSQTERQGIKMAASYLHHLNYPDNHHHFYGGLFLNNELVAYIWFVEQGEMVLVNRILGHAAHLKKGIMYLLFSSSIKFILKQKIKINWVMYDMFFGASEGLKLFKTRLGFKPYFVGWKK
ncbi:hypothetical protein LBMAG27_24820 [Bacteroidota bacterium]|nr:hypothetical protein LBMAG27_24820 [Bacteroidota bacterium]